jgi:hypothetical protein
MRTMELRKCKQEESRVKNPLKINTEKEKRTDLSSKWRTTHGIQCIFSHTIFE